LSFDLTFNSGISFSMSRHGASWVTLGTLLVAAAVAIVGLRAPDGLVAAGYGLLLGGGLGNVIDRMASTPHLVTDFIKVSNFPIFNMSDICVSAGFLVLAIAAFRGERLIA
jgi:signal peptidase II